MATRDRFVPPLPDIRRLSVCAGSAALFGPLRYDDVAVTEQRCRNVECRYRRDRTHRGTGLREATNDLRMDVELCHCCASTIMTTGSRWSLFYCDPCADRVRKLERDAGCALIPLGRHSAMNGGALSGADAAKPRRRAAFVRATMGIFDRIGRVDDWRRLVVAERIDAIRPGAHSMPAMEYLSWCKRHAPSRPEMFRRLCRYSTSREITPPRQTLHRPR